MDEVITSNLLDLTADVVTAFVANNQLAAHEVPGLIAQVHASLSGLGRTTGPAEPAPVKLSDHRIRRSIKPHALISFEDGKPYKSLKRHLRGRGMTLADYREKWGLPADYPSVAATYSEQRSALAKNMGLGRRAGADASSTARPARANSR